MIVPGADYSPFRTSLPTELVPKISGINAVYCAAKFDAATGALVNAASSRTGTDLAVLPTFNKPAKVTNAPFTTKPVLAYVATLETRKVSTTPVKFSENKWSIAIVYANSNILTMNVQRTLLTLVNSSNTEALVVQPTCSNSVFRVLQYEGTIAPLSGVTGGTSTSHESTFNHAFNAKGVVTITYDGTTLRIYDGAVKKKEVVTAISFKQGTMYLGTDARLADASDEMKGWIGLINLYDRALTDAEVTSLSDQLSSAYS